MKARQILIGSPRPAAFSVIKASIKIPSKIPRLDSMGLLFGKQQQHQHCFCSKEPAAGGFRVSTNGCPGGR